MLEKYEVDKVTEKFYLGQRNAALLARMGHVLVRSYLSKTAVEILLAFTMFNVIMIQGLRRLWNINSRFEEKLYKQQQGND